MTLPDTLEERYTLVRQRIADAAARAGRRADEIILVAVTKNAEPDQIRALLNLGHRDLGENRVQHLIQRSAMIEEMLLRRRVLPSASSARSALLDSPAHAAPPQSVRWHMIGRLQRNKARRAIDCARLIHSVDSLRLAEEIQAIAVRRELPVEILIQVNCSGEAAKGGCPIPAARHLAEQIDTMAYVTVRGLMTMAPTPSADATDGEHARPAFARCRELFEDIKRSGVSGGRFNLLSMGMTDDFEVAISEGANILRVGSAIFGKPTNPETHEEEPAEVTDADEP